MSPLSQTLDNTERALVIRILREGLVLTRHRIEQQKSQAKRGLLGSATEVVRLQSEYNVLLSAIQKLWVDSLETPSPKNLEDI
jgi:hypothetical protein